MIFKNPLLIYILAFIPLILPFIKSVVREQFTWWSWWRQVHIWESESDFSPNSTGELSLNTCWSSQSFRFSN